MLTRELIAGFSSHFWGAGAGSAQSLDGLVVAGPGEPSPLPTTSPSGLSRTQFLVASQAVTLPCFPTYCRQHGGLVLDRVLFKSGGEGWWTSMSGRMKIQNILSGLQDENPFDEAKNPANYILSSQTKCNFGRATSLKVKAELDGEGLPRGRHAPRSPSDPPAPPAGSATVQLRQKLHGAEVRAELGLNRRLLSGSTGLLGYSSAPVTSAVDVGTPCASGSPLQWRVGVHHATGPADGNGGGGGGGAGGGLRTALHAQGAVALQGERTLWRRSSSSSRAGGRDSSSGSGAGARAGARRGALSAPASLSVAGQQGAGAVGAASVHNQKTKTIGPHNPLRQSLSKLASSLRQYGQGGGGHNDIPHKGGKGGDHGSGHAAGGGAGLLPFDLPNPESLQESVLDSTQSISRLREDVQSITGWLQQGNLEKSLHVRGGRGEASRARGRALGKTLLQGPWSAFLLPSHLKNAFSTRNIDMCVESMCWDTSCGRHGPRGAPCNMDHLGSGGARGGGGSGGAGGEGGAGSTGTPGSLHHQGSLSLALARQASWIEQRVRQSAAGRWIHGRRIQRVDPGW
ncbi:hypothetical protein FOA52_013359 [Chlamydomonas sp. UWO 241]|nr:hypothetical protein FOA52_013359 [Chlamydomonas sp. UWO 241]